MKKCLNKHGRFPKKGSVGSVCYFVKRDIDGNVRKISALEIEDLGLTGKNSSDRKVKENTLHSPPHAVKEAIACERSRGNDRGMDAFLWLNRSVEGGRGERCRKMPE